MSYDNLDDLIKNVDYQNALTAMTCFEEASRKLEEYDMANKMFQSWKRLSNDYINFYLTNFDSEGRKVIRKVYKILGYNPNIDKRLQ